MTAEQLHDALSLLPGDLIEEADALRQNPKKAPIPFRRWAALAAALVLVAGCGLFAMKAGLLPRAGSGKSTEAIMQDSAKADCEPEAPAAAAPDILTDDAPVQEEVEYSRNEAAEPTSCSPPVDVNSTVFLWSDLPAVMVELLKTAQAAESFCTYYDEDWFREHDLLLIVLPGVGSLSDYSVGQGSSPAHWQIRVTQESPAEDSLMLLIPVEKGHIPKDAEFEVIWE